MLLSYCVVNTNGREHLLACLDAIERTHPEGVEHEVLVLDNASDDGSAEAVRERDRGVRLIALERRAGKAENDSHAAARGARALLPAAERGLRAAGRARRGRCSTRSRPTRAPRRPAPSSSRARASRRRAPGGCPDVGWALAAAVFLQRPLAVAERRRRSVREVGWAQSSAMLVRREAAEQVGFLDPDFFVYSDETDFCKRLRDAGWRILYVPGGARDPPRPARHRPGGMRRRIVEFHRGRDLYMRKHHRPGSRLAWRACWTWAYLVRALAALVLPGHDPRRYLLHARQELLPGRGEGIREAAEAYNRG